MRRFHKAKPRVLAVSSPGGHWVQLMRLKPAFDGCDVAYATCYPEYEKEVPNSRFYTFCDGNGKDHKAGLARMIPKVASIVLREMPDIVISTGAAPGYFAIRVGKAIGARTIWVDSIANVEQLSRAGSLAQDTADLLLTQWPHLAAPFGPRYRGAVL